MLIRTENPSVVLREWSEADRDSLIRYANDRHVWRNLTDAFPHPYTHADATEWFRRVQAPSVDALLAEWNPASMRVLEKCGFILESIRRKSVLKDGKLIDEMIYVAIKDP